MNNVTHLKLFAACKTISLILTTLVLLPLSSINSYAAIIFDTKLIAGLDSNPHRLSDQFATLQEEFAIGDFNFEADYEKTLYLKADAKKAFYFNDDRANWFQANVELGAESDFTVFEETFEYGIKFNQSTFDKTYVSELTGRVAGFDGQFIADRYDYSQGTSMVFLSYRNEREANFRLRIGQKTKDFEDYEIPGLINLDYSNLQFGADIEFQVDKVGLYYLNLDYIEREYDDRRAKDLEGIDVADSNLRYYYGQFNAGYLYTPNEDTYWRYEFKYSARTDNESEFYATDYAHLAIKSHHQLFTYHALKTALKISDYGYDFSFDRNYEILEDHEKPRRGISLQLDYEWVMATLFDSELGFYVSINAAVFDSEVAEYIYQRNYAAVGFKWTL